MGVTPSGSAPKPGDLLGKTGKPVDPLPMAARRRDPASDDEDTDVSDEEAAPTAGSTRSWRQRLSRIVHPGAAAAHDGRGPVDAAPPARGRESEAAGADAVADGPVVPAPSAALARFGQGSHFGLRAAEDEVLTRGLASRRAFLHAPIAEDAPALQVRPPCRGVGRPDLQLTAPPPRRSAT